MGAPLSQLWVLCCFWSKVPNLKHSQREDLVAKLSSESLVSSSTKVMLWGIFVSGKGESVPGAPIMNLTQPTAYSSFHLPSQNSCEVGRYPSSHIAGKETKPLNVKENFTQGLTANTELNRVSVLSLCSWACTLPSALLSTGGNRSSWAPWLRLPDRYIQPKGGRLGSWWRLGGHRKEESTLSRFAWAKLPRAAQAPLGLQVHSV